MPMATESPYYIDKDGTFWKRVGKKANGPVVYRPLDTYGELIEHTPPVTKGQLIASGLRPEPATEMDVIWKYVRFLEGVLRANNLL